MAEIVEVGEQRYTRRNPLGAWGLAFLTLGIYYFVWHYKVNDEARRFLGDETIQPWIAVLAVTLGALVLVPPYVSVYRTGERMRRMQQHARVTNEVSAALGLLGAFFLILNLPYYQENLNRVWERYAPTQQLPAAAPPPPS